MTSCFELERRFVSGTPANQERKGGEERDQQLRAERGCLRKEGSGVLNHLINSNCRRSVPLCCRCMPAVPKCAKRAKCRCRLQLLRPLHPPYALGDGLLPGCVGIRTNPA